jgi:hypothetical protein
VHLLQQTSLPHLSGESLTRWEFALALAAAVVVGTAELIGALMGPNTVITPSVVRATYVGVPILTAFACLAMLFIDGRIDGRGSVGHPVAIRQRDALYAATFGLAALILVSARVALPLTGIVAASASAYLLGHGLFVLGGRRLRWFAAGGALLTGYAVWSYAESWFALIGCDTCPRAPLTIVAAGFGAILVFIGAQVGWEVLRFAGWSDTRDWVHAGAVTFVLAAVFFLVHDPVRASFTVLTLVGIALASYHPYRRLDRIRPLVVIVGGLALGGLEALLGPEGAVPIGGAAILIYAALRVPTGWPRFVAATVCTGLGVAVSVNVVPPWDFVHHGFFLFPMRDVASGKSVLIDVNAQYGVGLIYALSMIGGGAVEALTPTRLSAWTNVANVTLYLGLWVLCARVTGNWATAGVFWLAVVVSRSVSMGVPEAFPSTGAWRFGLPWLLIADAVVREERKYIWRRVLRVSYWAVAATWSLEVALYSVALVAFDLCLQLGMCLRSGTTVRAWRIVWTGVAEVAVGAGTGVALLVAMTRWRAGDWPDLRHYFEYFGTYGAGLGFETPVLWSAWSPMFIGSVVTASVLGARVVLLGADTADGDQARLVAMVAAYGVLQFTYYVFRPHSNNLLHVMFPTAVVLIWLLSKSDARESLGDTTNARAMIGATIVAGASLVAAVGLTALVPRVPTTLVGQAMRLWGQEALWSGPWFGENPSRASDGEPASLRELLARRFPGATRVPMVIDDDLWVDAIIGIGVVNAFPLSFASQDSLIPIGRSAAVVAARTVPFGTNLVIETEWARVQGLRLDVLNALCSRGALIPVESGLRVSVVRLVLASTDDLCTKLRT